MQFVFRSVRLSTKGVDTTQIISDVLFPYNLYNPRPTREFIGHLIALLLLSCALLIDIVELIRIHFHLLPIDGIYNTD